MRVIKAKQSVWRLLIADRAAQGMLLLHVHGSARFVGWRRVMTDVLARWAVGPEV